jgi:hypothetical protein
LRRLRHQIAGGDRAIGSADRALNASANQRVGRVGVKSIFLTTAALDFDGDHGVGKSDLRLGSFADQPLQSSVFAEGQRFISTE